MYCLEAELGKRVEFRGVDSTLVQSALKRTENGGRLTPELFNSVMNLITCMNYIHSLVKSTFQSQTGVVQERLEPLMDLVQDLSGNKHLAKEISKVCSLALIIFFLLFAGDVVSFTVAVLTPVLTLTDECQYQSLSLFLVHVNIYRSLTRTTMSRTMLHKLYQS